MKRRLQHNNEIFRLSLALSMLSVVFIVNNIALATAVPHSSMLGHAHIPEKSSTLSAWLYPGENVPKLC